MAAWSTINFLHIPWERPRTSCSPFRLTFDQTFVKCVKEETNVSFNDDQAFNKACVLDWLSIFTPIPQWLSWFVSLVLSPIPTLCVLTVLYKLQLFINLTRLLVLSSFVRNTATFLSFFLSFSSFLLQPWVYPESHWHVRSHLFLELFTRFFFFVRFVSPLCVNVALTLATTKKSINDLFNDSSTIVRREAILCPSSWERLSRNVGGAVGNGNFALFLKRQNEGKEPGNVAWEERTYWQRSTAAGPYYCCHCC